ncbi:unnamed protein product [Clonostachys byssicola]|uniref:Uncharacterized protein n=1 Tax=Clonostachys byssicola TaxID=160290 RepID=A0A9N9URA5_9HYPO|nr:unnamed protein product [Clonostachys byssicola]
MPDIQDAFQAALIIALLVTLALAVLLLAVVAALRYWQPQQQPTETERRRSLYYPSTRSSVENAYRIAYVPDPPVFRHVDWTYGTFQGNRFESGRACGSRGFTVDDEHSVNTRWEHASPRGQLGGLRRMGVEERRDAASSRLEAAEDLTEETQVAGREGRDVEETSGSSTPLASNQGAGAASGWADRTRGGRGHSV